PGGGTQGEDKPMGHTGGGQKKDNACERAQLDAQDGGREEEHKEPQSSAKKKQDVSAEVEGAACGQSRADGNEDGGCTLGGVEEAIIRGGVLASIKVTAQRGEDGDDFRPSEEGEGAEDDEEQRAVGKGDEQVDRDRLEAEGQGHRVLTAYVVGDPAPERAAKAIDDAVGCQGEGESQDGPAQDIHGAGFDVEIPRQGGELRGGHQAAASNHGHHEVHKPEVFGGKHLRGGKVHGALALPDDLATL